MKKFIVLVIASLLLYMIVLLVIPSNSDRIKMISSQSLIENDKLKIIKPVLYGLSNKNEVFKLTAASGVQSNDAKELLFDNVLGEITMSRDHSTIAMKADKSIIYPSEESIVLLGNVVMESTLNYNAKTEKAIISLESYDVWGEVPVSMNSKYGNINSNTFHFFNNKQIIEFEGNVITVIK